MDKDKLNDVFDKVLSSNNGCNSITIIGNKDTLQKIDDIIGVNKFEANIDFINTDNRIFVICGSKPIKFVRDSYYYERL